jgi:ribonuclease R
LGAPGEHETEIHSILAEYGLPYEFPQEVELDADKIDRSITDEEVAKRWDMRKSVLLPLTRKMQKILMMLYR